MASIWGGVFGVGAEVERSRGGGRDPIVVD